MAQYHGELAFLSGPHKGRRMPLTRNSMRLGRDAKCEIVLEDEASSRIHSVVYKEGDHLFVQDLKSTNGTYLNNARLTEEPVQLSNGDRIGIGDTIFLLLIRSRTDAFPSLTFAEDVETSSTRLTLNITDTQFLELDEKIPPSEAHRSFSLLYEFMMDLSGTLHREALLEKVLEHLFRAFNPDRGLVVLLEPEKEPSVRASRIKEGVKVPADIAISRTMAGHLLEKGESFVSVDAESDKRLDAAESLHALHVRSVMGAPLKVKDRVLGMIYLDTFGATDSFSEGDLKLCSAIALQTAAYLENSRLYMELLDTNEFNNTVMRALTSGIIVVDKKGKVVRANLAAVDIIGIEEHELIGRNIAKIEGLDELDQVLKGTLSSGTGEDRYEVHINRKERIIPLGLSTSLVSDHTGDTIGAVAHFRDLTGVRKLETQLRRSQHLAGLGRMAAGVAHEIRNPLNSIRGFAQLLEDGVKKTAGSTVMDPSTESDPYSPMKMVEYSGIVLEEVDRMNRIVQDLLDFSREKRLNKIPLKMGELLKRIVREMEPDTKEAGVPVIVKSPDDDLPDVPGDNDRLHQVFLNIIRNAVQASPKGETVNIEFHVNDGAKLEKEEEEKPASIVPRRELSVHIQDWGPGIPKESFTKIFDPFFSTKDIGTGLGLSICQKIIDRHDGRIEIQSEVGNGSTFIIHLPLSEDSN